MNFISYFIPAKLNNMLNFNMLSKSRVSEPEAEEPAEPKAEEQAEPKAEAKAEAKAEQVEANQEPAEVNQEPAEVKQEPAEAKEDLAEAKQEPAEAKQEPELKQEQAEPKEAELSEKQEPVEPTMNTYEMNDIDEESFVSVPIAPVPKPEKKQKMEDKPLKRVLVFDVETTGLCPKHVFGQPFPPDHLYPHILQLSYVVYDMRSNTIVDRVNEYVRIAENIPITEEIQRITGISRQTIRAKGVPLAPLLLRFYDSMMTCDAIVAHNIQYDKTVIRKEMYRYKSEIRRLSGSAAKADQMSRSLTDKFFQSSNIQSICTMMSSIQLCNLWYVPNGAVPTLDDKGNATDPVHRRKMPKLCELYEYLFEKPAPEGMHDAMVDVLACLDCFVEIKRRQAIEQVEKAVEQLVEKVIATTLSNVVEQVAVISV